MAQAAAARIGVAGWLRIALRTSALAAFLLVCLLLYALAAPFARRNPVAPMFLAGALRIVGGRLAIKGAPATEPSILLANHLSWMDILALAGATRSVFVAHDGLAAHPAMRFLCDLNRTVFIARGDRGSVAGQVEQVQQGLQRSGILTVFPEGTTSDGSAVTPFKSSLLASVEGGDAGVAIRPVWLDYGPDVARIAWAGDEPGLANFQRVLARPGRLDVTVHLLPPLTGEERRDRKTIAAAARDAIVTKMEATQAALPTGGSV